MPRVGLSPKTSAKAYPETLSMDQTNKSEPCLTPLKAISLTATLSTIECPQTTPTCIMKRMPSKPKNNRWSTPSMQELFNQLIRDLVVRWPIFNMKRICKTILKIMITK
jgi:hypothetical protein